MDLIEEHWEEIKEGIKKEYEIMSAAYNVWIAPLKYYQCVDNKVTILVPNDQYPMVSYITKRYKAFFQVAISEFAGDTYDVEFALESQYISPDHEKNESQVNEENIGNNTLLLKEKEANLNHKYHFENFVVGTNNNMAHSACLAVAESLGKDFNPLFIYGGSGLGKTHLLHSIGHYIIENYNNKKVLYVTSEEFTNEVVESIRQGQSNSNINSMSKLREKYRNIDVLLIDDIQFIIGRTATQEEFFHTFNALHSAGKAIIISSDKHPKEINVLDERYRSRFEWGLIVDIQPPVYETRVAILMKYAETFNKDVPKDVIEYIAENIKSNVRELEGAFNKVKAFSKINQNKPIDLELAKEALKDTISPDKPTIITPNLILDIVANHYGIDPDDIISKKRTSKVTVPRHVFMYLCRDMTNTTLEGIGALLERDHSTVKHGVDKIEEEIKTDNKMKEKIEMLKNIIISS